MIRINLLPVKAQHRLSAGIRQLVIMGSLVVVSIIMVVLISVYFGMEIDRRKDSIQRVETEIKRLEELIGEVNQLEADKKKLLAQLEVIRKLERGKSGPVRMLDSLADSLPKRVWLTDIREQGQQVSFKGYGVENADISEFMSALEKASMFSNVALKYTTSAKIMGQSVYEFSLAASVNFAE